MISVQTNHVRCLASAEADEVAAAFRTQAFEVTQTGAGTWRTEFTSVFLDDVALTTGYVDCDYVIRGAGRSDAVTVSAATSSPTGLRNGRPLGVNDVGIIKPGGELCCTEHPGAQSRSIAIRTAEFQACSEAMLDYPNHDLREEMSIVQTSPARLSHLRGLMDEFTLLARTSPEVFDSEEMRAVTRRSLVTAAVLASEDVSRRQARDVPLVTKMHHFREASVFLQDQGRRPIFVADLCHAVGVSERTLRYAFKELCGLSPSRYLRLRSLQMARNALLRPTTETSVTTVAFEHGFWALGSFAAEYRALFAENPSTTLRRGQAEWQVQPLSEVKS